MGGGNRERFPRTSCRGSIRRANLEFPFALLVGRIVPELERVSKWFFGNRGKVNRVAEQQGQGKRKQLWQFDGTRNPASDRHFCLPLLPLERREPVDMAASVSPMGRALPVSHRKFLLRSNPGILPRQHRTPIVGCANPHNNCFALSRRVILSK